LLSGEKTTKKLIQEVAFREDQTLARAGQPRAAPHRRLRRAAGCGSRAAAVRSGEVYDAWARCLLTNIPRCYFPPGATTRFSHLRGRAFPAGGPAAIRGSTGCTHVSPPHPPPRRLGGMPFPSTKKKHTKNTKNKKQTPKPKRGKG